jgi:DNA modification methylase
LTEYGVIARFKPMLWFVKGTRSDKHTFVENVVAGPREKDYHEWQQAESDAAYFIEKLSPTDGLVVDFFAGGGTTIVVARQLGRNAIGYENNPKHHAAACKRIAAHFPDDLSIPAFIQRRPAS